MKKVYDFIKEAGIYYLATLDGNKPKVRPFGTTRNSKILEAQLFRWNF